MLKRVAFVSVCSALRVVVLLVCCRIERAVGAWAPRSRDPVDVACGATAERCIEEKTAVGRRL
eukprot:1572752-Pyramimonas_sp.AAC.1